MLTFGLRRACAVHGGTYILGSQGKISDLQVMKTSQEDGGHPITFRIPAHHEPVTTDLLVDGGQLNLARPSSGSQSPAGSTTPMQANCVAILQTLPAIVQAAFSTGQNRTETDDGESVEENIQDVMLMIFPPGSVSGGSQPAVRALLMGPETGSCPADQCESSPYPLATVGLSLAPYSHPLRSSNHGGISQTSQGDALPVHRPSTRKPDSRLHRISRLTRDAYAFRPTARTTRRP